MQKMLNQQVKAGGIRVISGPTIPPPPGDPTQILLSYFNYPGLPPVVIFDLGTVTVQGTYQQITDNIEAWSNMPHFLAVADGLKLQGTSPILTATYQVSIVGFLQTDPTRPIFPPVPPEGQLVGTTTTAAPGTPGANPAGTTGAAGPSGTTPPAGTGAAGAARVPVRPRTPGTTAVPAQPAAGTATTARIPVRPPAGNAATRGGTAVPPRTAGPAGGIKPPVRPPAGTAATAPKGPAGSKGP